MNKEKLDLSEIGKQLYRLQQKQVLDPTIVQSAEKVIKAHIADIAYIEKWIEAHAAGIGPGNKSQVS